MAPSKKRTIFVTVGTTLFEALIEAATSKVALDWMIQAGYTHLILQYGKGRKPVLFQRYAQQGSDRTIEIELYDFKPSLSDDMQKADLIVSHAGAGTVMEALRLKKSTRLVVVINTILMDNHQTELAHAMGSRNYIHVVDEPALLNETSTWNELDQFVPEPYTGGDEHDFPRILDRFMGFTKDD